MKGFRSVATLKMLGAGLVLLQVAGCTATEFNEFLQTILLGVTAAGGIAIIQNI